MVVGAGDAALGWGALIQRAVLGLPAQKEREEGTSFTPVICRRDKPATSGSGERGKGKEKGSGFLLLSTPTENLH